MIIRKTSGLSNTVVAITGSLALLNGLFLFVLVVVFLWWKRRVENKAKSNSDGCDDEDRISQAELTRNVHPANFDSLNSKLAAKLTGFTNAALQK